MNLFIKSLKFVFNTIEPMRKIEFELEIPEQPLFLNIQKDFLNADLAKDFCKSFQYSDSVDNLNNQCANLTYSNCNKTDCCVSLNGKNCVSGSRNGPTFFTNTNGTKINMDYYYYQGKCFGNKCPK
jgi:hypothetical protein